MKDRVTVVFSVLFQDDDDIVLGKVFMQVRSRLSLKDFHVLFSRSHLKEFKEGRRANQQAPQVLFSHKDPPQELKDALAD